MQNTYKYLFEKKRNPKSKISFWRHWYRQKDTIFTYLGLDMGFGLVIGFIGLLLLVTTGNYESFKDLNTLQNTIAAHIKLLYIH
jgi:hypothetical protein